jgi:glycosyltransferase involved in cell wall biosynthesis
MISFVVIGKNSSKTIKACLESIYNICGVNFIDLFEIIYVDSKSTDNTLQIVEKFKDVKRILLTGDTNAAIGRNVGVKHAKYDILFLVDSDTVLKPEFLKEVLNDDMQLKYDYVAGSLEEHSYTLNWVPLNITQPKLYKPYYTIAAGGISVIKKKHFLAEPQNPKMRIGQDWEQAIRLANKGVRHLLIPTVMSEHHLQEYTDLSRFIKDIKKGNYLYSGVIFREHFFSSFLWRILLKREKTVFILIAALILTFTGPYNALWLPSYILLLLARFKLNLRKTLIYSAQDIFILIGFFFFPRKKNVSEKVLNESN